MILISMMSIDAKRHDKRQPEMNGSRTTSLSQDLVSPSPDTWHLGGIPPIRVKLMKTSIHKDPNASAFLWMKFQPARARILFYDDHKLSDQFPASVTERIKESFL